MSTKKVIKGLVALSSLAAAAAVVGSSAKAMHRIVPAGGINEGIYVDINGARQWITIYGQDVNNPVLLYLHGGPGGATSDIDWACFQKIGDVFTVVSWDQRNCGKSHDDAQNGVRITPELFKSDVIELTKYLLARFGKEKLTLCGLSWGSVLGSNVALEYPEYFNAWIPMGLAVDFAENEAYMQSVARSIAEETGDEKLLEIAESYDPTVFGEEQNKTRNKLIKAIYNESMITEPDVFLPWAMLTSPHYTFTETLKKLFGKFAPKAQLDDFLYVQQGFQQMSIKDRTEYKMPYFLIEGDHDSNCMFDLAVKYYERVQAPEKKLYTVDGGHAAPLLKTAEFSRIMREIAARLRELGALE